MRGHITGIIINKIMVTNKTKIKNYKNENYFWNLSKHKIRFAIKNYYKYYYIDKYYTISTE